MWPTAIANRAAIIFLPISLVEGLTPSTSTTPWLGPVGLAITALVFALGCAATFLFQQGDPFRASTGQWIGSGVVAVILVAIAVLLAFAWRQGANKKGHLNANDITSQSI